MSLTLLTATGMRPEAWALCQRWMARQDYRGPVRWVIVDDGPQPQPLDVRADWTIEHVRPYPSWRAGDNTQSRNLLAGLARIAPEASVVLIEDDDWYAPDWLTTVAGKLAQADLVGETHARYYNVRSRRWAEHRNELHASLCATALRGPALAALREVCRYLPRFLDIELWRQTVRRRLFTGHRVVGIKGLPGRPGIGMGHQPHFGHPDPRGERLAEWIGPDAVWYVR